MKPNSQTIYRNLAIISAIFIVAFAIMLVTNYFQVRSVDTFSMIENLKQVNEETGDSAQLQEQIRKLDLLARNAYFISLHRLQTGIAILLGMVIVFVVTLRLYFAKTKDIPEKEIASIDDWFIKSKIRKYLVWIAGTLALFSVIFAVLTTPFMNGKRKIENDKVRMENGEWRMETEDLKMENGEWKMKTEDLKMENEIAITDTISILNSQFTIHNSNGFRGNNSLGISDAKEIPTLWDLLSGKNILWKVNVPRKGFNSTVINGNRVFFSGADEEARELFCYELSSGKLLWSLAVQNVSGSPSQMPKTEDDTGLAASTVATNGKVVCAIFATGDVVCADMNGKQLWAKNIGVPDNPYGYASSLLIYENSLFIQYDNRNSPRVIALDLANGNQCWTKERPEKNPSWSSPILATVNNKPQLILTGNPGVTSYNPNSGDVYWRVECMSGEPAPSPAFANGIVFVATEYASMTAINAVDGAVLWKQNEFLPEISSPVATKDFVFVATSYGVVATYNPQTGDLIKTMELNTDFHSSPVVVDGKIYLFSTDGKMYIFSAKGDFSLINSFETGEKMYATPAFTDGKVVVRTEKSVYCVSEL